MKFDVTLSGFSKSLDVRQVRQQIAEIKKAQLLRQKRLRSLIAMSNYAKSKGVSVSEMTSLTKENLSENKKNLQALNKIAETDRFKKAEVEFKKKTSKIKFKNISGGGGMMTTFKKGKTLIEKMKDL
tara:strand:+ start:410 stop:790 length:381 start_codon:yes stop_codon:yes gene_type:complete